MGAMGEGGDPPPFQRQLHRHPVTAGRIVDRGGCVGSRQVARAHGVGSKPEKLAAIKGIGISLICHPIVQTLLERGSQSL